VLAGLLLVLLLPSQPSAQTSPSILLDLYAGDCLVVITGFSEWGAGLWISPHPEPAKITWYLSGNNTVTIQLRDGLRAGDVLKINQKSAPETPLDAGTVLDRPATLPAAQSCQPEKTSGTPKDEREAFSAIGRVGQLVETFAPQGEGLKLQFAAPAPTKAGETAATPGSATAGRVMFSFDVDARLHTVLGRPLWLTSRVLYGARQSAICQQGTENASAQDTTACTGSGIPQPEKALVIARQADSTEVDLGFRYEFYELPADSVPGSVYVSCSAGSIFILGVGDKALDHHHCGIGAIVTRGRFRQSYVEYGRGRSEIFAPDVNTGFNRNLVDVLVTFNFVGLDVELWKRSLKSIRPFVGVSLDRGKVPDSLVTTFGIGFDMARLFGGL